MAENKPEISFEEMIKNDRQKKKNEVLANQILGKGRRASTPGTTFASRKAPFAAGGSLASRMGITKPSQRSSSAAPKPKPNISDPWIHDLHSENNPQASRVSRLPARGNMMSSRRGNQLFSALRSVHTQQNGTRSAPNELAYRAPSKGIRIRGVAAGSSEQDLPLIMVAENFAPGTTAQDIESAMKPFGGEDLRVTSLLQGLAGVTAEIEVWEIEGAELLIATFHDQIADGRKLNVYINSSKPAPSYKHIPTGPRAGRGRRERSPDSAIDASMQDSERRRADIEYQDGSYGFGGGRSNGQDRKRDERKLYSDDLFGGTRGYSR